MSTKKHILIAEDETPLAKALQYKLQSAGYQVSAVENGKKALELLRANTFDLVLLDLVMPVLDGFGVLEGLRKQNNKTPVIVLSNLGQESDVQTAKDLGAKDFYIKSDTQLSEIEKKLAKFFGV